KRGAALAARFADEFNVAFRTDEVTEDAFDRIRAAARETGRKVALSIARTCCVARDEAGLRVRADAIGRDVTELRDLQIGGTPNEVVDRIGRFAELGASRVYLQMNDLDDLDQLELIAAEVLPQV
ncbi:MAG: hypothetical protein QOG80_1450, partial [Pseudonocardiales bacterium]|nr:hypothetical protein [Pseudonocardiales bacterium]